ncbi:MAG: hypothetical protein H0W76_20810 [Pyrinomonadaceae bacterium]|nr:hypothetical protein [Pyrinomonadaceae bacterium]
MSSPLWLKDKGAPNVSQSDVARAAREKQERASMQEAAAPLLKKTADLSDELNGVFDNSTNLKDRPSSSTPSTTSVSSTPRTPSTAKSIAPERDFQRVPNSVTRKAIPEGVFRGKSKQVWDYLWSVSRGAIAPSRNVRKSRRQIKTGSGLGSMVTVDAAIQHLESVGLISIKPAVGSLIGNEYEVFTPEEAATRTTSTSSISSPTQKVVLLDKPQSGSTSTTQIAENNNTSIIPNTSFKTNTNDDDALDDFNRIFTETVRDLTGKEPLALEREKWAELARVITNELKQAAAKTSVSCVPAFLATHLKRRLAKQVSSAIRERSQTDATMPPDVGRTASESRQQMTPEQTMRAVELMEHGMSAEEAAAMVEREG